MFDLKSYLVGKHGGAYSASLHLPSYLMGRVKGGGGITGTLPLTVRSLASQVLKNYRIYGTSGGVGEMGNSFNVNRERSDEFTLDTDYYLYGGIADSRTVAPTMTNIEINDNQLMVYTGSSGHGAGFVIEVKPSTTYTLSFDTDVTVPNNRTSAALNTINENGVFGYYWGIYGSGNKNTFETKANTKYVYIVFRVSNTQVTYSNIMFTEGPTAPDHYIPYGYKLPITVTAGGTTTNYPLYIGDSQLMEGEYVDYEEQKIYKMINGVLTPTDPPVLLPDITMPEGEVTIDIEGELKPKATIKGEIERI